MHILRLLLFISLFFSHMAFAADSYIVTSGASVEITEHSDCAIVTNGITQNVWVPTKAASEWASFRSTPPPGVTAVACDTTPNAFTFTDVTGQALSTLIYSNTLTIAGINAATPVSVSGTGSPTVSINGGAWATSGTITNGQSLRVRLTSANAFSSARSATVNVGGVTDNWSVTTRAANNCASTTISWSPGCSAASGTMTHSGSKSITNTAGGHTGTRNLSCNDGTITGSGGSCATTGPTCGNSTGPGFGFISSRRCSGTQLAAFQVADCNYGAGGNNSCRDIISNGECKWFCEQTPGTTCCQNRKDGPGDRYHCHAYSGSVISSSISNNRAVNCN